MKKVLFVIGSLEVGGAEQHVVRVATALQSLGWTPHVFSFYLPGPLQTKLAAAGVPVYGVTLPIVMERHFMPKKIIVWWRLAVASIYLHFLLWRQRYDVVHFFLPAAYLIGGIVSQFAPVGARVMSRRSRNFYQNGRVILRSVERLLHRRMDAICGNSKSVINDLIDEKVEASKLHLIYTGIDIERFSSPVNRISSRHSLGLDGDELVFICVANLIRYKGHTDLISAFAAVSSRISCKWRLLCVGRDDGIGNNLRALADQRGIGHLINFLGSRDDVDSLLQISDVGVLASHEEGFSNALLEMMAAGLPVIATDVGGNAEAVKHGQTGLIVKPSNPAELGEAIVRITEASQRQRNEMGAAGKQKIKNEFSIALCINRYCALYDGLQGNVS